ncbi:MAG TPA: carboxypeptidase-like regulatory domain-containing protein, partial [Pyrinomonadaceae bacterium]|nr:carboxypeptidase-like regulatory domain-containing protein [Pyrinomonadaceae bacterium]
MFVKSIGRAFVLALLLSFTTSVADSQTYSASIVGLVTDDHGGGLGGVNVSLSKTESGDIVAETRTDKEGRYKFMGLLAGSFTLDFASTGWQSRRLDPVEIRAHTTIEIDASLARSDAPAPKPSLRVQDGEVAWGKLFAETAFQRLPSTRTVWSILESQEQSTVTDVLDIGGLKVGRPALTGAHGASWTEAEYLFDGLNVTDPYIPGRPLLYPAFDDISTFEVITASKPASLSGSGVTLEIGAPDPTEGLHGTTRLFYSNHNLQSDNIDQRLQHFHFQGPERLEHLVDGEAQVGGKLPFDLTPWPVFGSFSAQNLEKSLGGFPAPIDDHVYSGLAKLRPYLRDPNQVDLLLAFQNV